MDGREDRRLSAETHPTELTLVLPSGEIVADFIFFVFFKLSA